MKLFLLNYWFWCMVSHLGRFGKVFVGILWTNFFYEHY